MVPSDRDIQLDMLLNMPYYVIDFLPRRVVKSNSDFFFEAEKYFSEGAELKSSAQKFVHIILKTLCYFEFMVYENQWLENLECSDLAMRITNIVTNQRETLNILLKQQNTLIQITGGVLNITVFHCSKEVEEIMKPLASSEGLFWWSGSN